jgi:hypothetical protein
MKAPDCSEDFEFEIEAVLPIGLTGEGQRPMHTNVIGRISKGSVKVGDAVFVPWKDGSWRRVAVLSFMTPHHAPSIFPDVLSADAYGSFACCLSLRVPPSESHQIDFEARPKLRGRDLPNH